MLLFTFSLFRGPLLDYCSSFLAVLPARVGFLVDSSTAPNFELIKRFVFNIGRMFRMEGSKYTIIQFGRNPAKIIMQEKSVCILTRFYTSFD